MPDIRLALNSHSYIPLFREKLALRRYKIRRDPLVYVLVGYDSSWEEDMERVLFLKRQGCRPYIQRHRNVAGISRYTALAEWCNQFWPVSKMSFEEFAKLRRERPDRKRKASAVDESL